MKPLFFAPDGTEIERALARTTHLGIGAHQDDLEIMAYHGISHCYQQEEAWFSGVTCTDGAGSPGPHSTPGELAERRAQEQVEAARMGHYSSMTQLGHASSEVRDPESRSLVRDLTEVLERAHPAVVYTHNPFDRHTTHLAVLSATLEALRSIPVERRPTAVYGCEVWRSLD